jgi:hypothetical protein
MFSRSNPMVCTMAHLEGSLDIRKLPDRPCEDCRFYHDCPLIDLATDHSNRQVRVMVLVRRSHLSSRDAV